MIRAAILMAATLSVTGALCAPFSVGVHVATLHSEHGFESLNPGAYAKAEEGVMGIYRNSEGRTSFYAGKVFSGPSLGPLSSELVLGGATGYAVAPIRPIVAPSVAVEVFGNKYRLTYLHSRVKAVHLSAEFVID